MKPLALIAPALLATALAGCATEGTVGKYAIGDDAAAVKQGRNRASALVSDGELRQHRRQRANAAEELALAEQKRRAARNEVSDSLSVANQGLGTLNNVIGTIRNLRSGF